MANQEKVDYSMPVRVMLQEALAYDRQIKELKRANQRQQKKQKEDSEKQPTDLLKTLVPQSPLYFLNLSEVHDYHNFHSEIRILFDLYDRRNDKTEFYSYLKHNDECRQIDEETVWALSKMLNINTEKLRGSVIQEEGGKSDMCRAIEELIADGKVEGKTEGRLEGDAARIVKSIESVMKNLKVEAARACEIIGVTIEEYQRAEEVTALPF